MPVEFRVRVLPFGHVSQEIKVNYSQGKGEYRWPRYSVPLTTDFKKTLQISYDDAYGAYRVPETTGGR